MADYAAQTITLTGLSATYHAAAAGGDTVPVGNNVYLHVKNTDAAAVTLTVVTPGTESGLAISDLTVNIPATNGDVYVGPLSPSLFQNPSDQKAHLTWSAQPAGLTFAVLSA